MPNPICGAANLACEGLKATARVALRAAEKVVDSSRIALDAANGVLIAAIKSVDASTVSLDIAVLALETASQISRLGTEAAFCNCQRWCEWSYQHPRHFFRRQFEYSL